MLLYSANADSTTPYLLAKEFANNYWGEPRKVKKFKAFGKDYTFSVSEGAKTYTVKYIPREVGVSPALLQIWDNTL